MTPKVSAVIITKNEEKMIANCIETLQWCDEVIVIDSGSDDNTVEIARKVGATVHEVKLTSFAQWRNYGLEHAKNEWVFYVDADERVVPQLSKEILVHVETADCDALSVKRQNMMYGSYFQFGGWGNEVMTRVFRKSALKGWTGEIHESPEFTGKSITLHTPLLHFTHRSTSESLIKSAHWTPLEAKLLYHSGIPPVTLFTLLRKGIMEFIRRAFFQKGYKDGMSGMIEAVVQGINRVLVYIQVWELQQKPSLPERYEEEERRILQLWKSGK